MKLEENIEIERVYEFINNFKTYNNKVLDEIQKQALIDEIPIIKNDVANFIYTQLKILKPSKILEIGTAVGYSAILMKTAMPDAKIDTLEINEKNANKARENIKKYGYEDSINIIFGDARENLPKLKDTYDFVFIDAAKGHYVEFFQEVEKNLKKGSLVLCDNVLYKGMVCVGRYEIVRRQRTIHKRMRMFLDYIYSLEDFSCDILPIGDGVLLAYKTK